MTLKPFLTGLVPDITIVPVNLSYDRVLEEVLFAYELLGVPKPKETTKGFLKALSILNENYGSVYVQFGDPISVREYFSSKIDRSVHGFGSVEMQDITPEELKFIINLAHNIIHKQRELTSLSAFNLIAAVLNDWLLRHSEPPDIDNLISEVQWLYSVFQFLVPKTVLILNSINENIVLYHLNLHKSLIQLTPNKKVQLCKVHSVQSGNSLRSSKGHELSNQTMDIAVPILMLQLYVNPCGNFLIGLCFVAIIIESKKTVTQDELFRDFEFFCSIFLYEFIFHSDFIQEDFTKALNQSKYFNILQWTDENKFTMGNNQKLRVFCINFLKSYIPAYVTLIEILLESDEISMPEKQIFKKCQEKLEFELHNSFSIHPANLSLDCLSNALQSFVLMKAVRKTKVESGFEYCGCKQELLNLNSALLKSNQHPQFNYGWEHHWCDPVNVKNLYIKEYVKGPFKKPKYVHPIPYVTLCQLDGSPITLNQGIPDCWAEYLTCNLRILQNNSQNYALMYKKDADIVPYLRKHYRLYIGQGIPDPWTPYPYINIPEFVSSKDLKGMTANHRKNFKSNSYKKACFGCQKKYLFECPDKCETLHSLRNCKNTSTTLCSEKCKCFDSLPNCLLRSQNLKRGKQQIVKKNSETSLSSTSYVDSDVEDECQDLNVKNLSNSQCECCNKIKTQGGGERKLKKLFKQNFRGHTCKESKSFHPHIKKTIPTQSVSKLIQAELEPIKISKTVQTEHRIKKKKVKCECSNKCFQCSIFQCRIPRCKGCCLGRHSFPNICCGRNLNHCPGFVCPFSATNHDLGCKSYTQGLINIKKHQNTTKHRDDKESEDESNQQSETENKKYWFKDKKLDNNGKNIYFCLTSPKTLNYSKHFTNDKLKYYLNKKECLTGRQTNINQLYSDHFRKEGKSYYRPDSLQPDRLKTFSFYKPKHSEFSFSESKVSNCRPYNSKIERFSFSDRGTMTLAEEIRRPKNKLLTEATRSKEIKSNKLGLQNEGFSKTMKKRRKLLANRKRRKKLTSSGKFSFMEYQAFLHNLQMKTNVNKQVQVEENTTDCLNAKEIISSDFSNYNSSMARNSSFDSNLIKVGSTWERTEVLSKNLSNDEKNKASEESLNQPLKSELQFGGIIEKISYNSGSTWSSITLKNIVNDLLAENNSTK